MILMVLWNTGDAACLSLFTCCTEPINLHGCNVFSMKKQRLELWQRSLVYLSPEPLCVTLFSVGEKNRLIARDVSVPCNKMTNKHQEKWEFINLRPSSNDKEEITLIMWCTKTRCYTSSSSGGTRCLICMCIRLLLGVLNILFVTGSNRAMSFLDMLCCTFKHPVP